MGILKEAVVDPRTHESLTLSHEVAASAANKFFRAEEDGCVRLVVVLFPPSPLVDVF